MIDKIKDIFLVYKYQLGGIVALVIVSLLYKYYFPFKENKEKSKESQLKTDEIQREIQTEIQSLQKKLVKTEKQLLKYKDEVNNKKELSLYENSQYNFNRTNKKILTLKWSVPVGADDSQKKTINEELQEPFVIDKLSDIYLDSFTTAYNGSFLDFSNQPDKASYVLKIDEFKIDSNSNDSNLYNSIVIPNEYSTTATTDTSRKTHKGKKLNFICSINPCTLTQITGTITDLAGNIIFNKAGDSFIAEFIFIARDK
tara:strand:+ start:190 stop:957 length:768 start_codon:yes stop_codon:yes gene_type:complete